MTTLAGDGAVEFWIVDPRYQTVTVYNRKSGMHVYTVESAVPLPYFEGQRLLVSDVFGEGFRRAEGQRITSSLGVPVPMTPRRIR